MMTLGSQDPKLSNIFFEAGPHRVVREMEGLLERIQQLGVLQFNHTHQAAEHFFCLLKGAPNFRVLYGCGDPLSPEEAEAHVQDVVALFMRAYRPD